MSVRRGPVFGLNVPGCYVRAQWISWCSDDYPGTTHYDLYVGFLDVCQLRTGKGHNIIAGGTFNGILADLAEYEEGDSLSVLGLTVKAAKKKLVGFASESMRELLGVPTSGGEPGTVEQMLDRWYSTPLVAPHLAG
jgi:hypothetical protein